MISKHIFNCEIDFFSKNYNVFESSSGMDPNAQPQQSQRYRKWDQQQQRADEGSPFVGAGGYGGPAPYGMHAYGGAGDRLVLFIHISSRG